MFAELFLTSNLPDIHIMQLILQIPEPLLQIALCRVSVRLQQICTEFCDVSAFVVYMYHILQRNIL